MDKLPLITNDSAKKKPNRLRNNRGKGNFKHPTHHLPTNNSLP
ncbi:hypothetical protein ADIS_0042 [Lunatimonas lonarensis]|uniref:Uncharacterized protein n=1 Tax=Lunatimonas lonarensis TaxID=1232681 RepID=R7ZZF8_9BACT|nr:hypothetical protein ADIS_0042 [Lunatimonas lonarensis]